MNHYSYVNPSGINYHLESSEGDQEWDWPGWLGDEEWEFITAIVFDYTYDGVAAHLPIRPVIVAWGYRYYIVDGTVRLSLKFPEFKEDGLMNFDVDGWPWQIYCPPPVSNNNEVSAQRQVTMYWNFRFMKNCFSAEVTGDDPFWFWIGRDEGNPPILCPPFLTER